MNKGVMLAKRGDMEDLTYTDKEKGDFSNFKISKASVETLIETGIKYLFPIQISSFDALYERKDLIGKDRTGSGKTLAFCLPILERLREKGKYLKNARGQRPYVLIVVPTRELAIQVCREMERFRNGRNEFRISAIYGGTDIRAQIDQLRSGVEVVIGTPGRLMDHIRRGTLSFKSLRTLILDETDQMLNIGFQEDIEFIIKSIESEFEEIKRKRSKLQIVLFSATVPRWVDKIARKFMKKDLVYVDLVKDGFNKTPTTVTHLAMQVPSPYQKLMSIADLVMVYGGSHSRTIIFTDTKGNHSADSSFATCNFRISPDLGSEEGNLRLLGFWLDRSPAQAAPSHARSGSRSVLALSTKDQLAQPVPAFMYMRGTDYNPIF